MRGPVTATVLVVLWGGAVVAGFTGLLVYGSTPGHAAAAPEQWPPSSEIARAAGRPTLVMIAHPHCPCTRASMSELSRLLAGVRSQPDTWIVVVRPEGTPEGWEEGTIISRAREMIGVRIHVDAGGTEAERFGTSTSGQTLLYAADGRLLFRGGITAARGHEGENAGRRTIAALLDEHAATGAAATTKVFGCPVDEAEATREGVAGWNP
jgi:hypothetical protein